MIVKVIKNLDEVSITTPVGFELLKREITVRFFFDRWEVVSYFRFTSPRCPRAVSVTLHANDWKSLRRLRLNRAQSRVCYMARVICACIRVCIAFGNVWELVNEVARK